MIFRQENAGFEWTEFDAHAAFWKLGKHAFVEALMKELEADGWLLKLMRQEGWRAE